MVSREQRSTIYLLRKNILIINIHTVKENKCLPMEEVLCCQRE